MASVRVAVRVRPFNQRELDMEAKLIIEMEGKKTRILNTKNQPKDGESLRENYKDFTFDHSYWSFNSNDAHYASQEQVFQDLGTDVVDSAFEGYNACVFAYGQTGSGKTFTMMGSPESQGLIPRICKTLFSRMKQGKEKGANYRTEVSYLEIYNERVKDLLSRDTSHNLRVREHPQRGPYVQALSHHLVTAYADIQELMHRGNIHRTTASTNMNDVSSRSHAIFTIMFVQAGFAGDMPSETVSKVHLVDLAGSERADATGATGQRLKEGAHINKSLVTLGSVISALAELSSISEGNLMANRSSRQVFIPYRDSVLTWLLKDSLGGNSKTIMIAAVSPADCNYSETLSTLRYANRAKNIINKPTINEDPNVKLIRELRAEISKLKSLLGNEYTPESQPQMLAQLQQKEAQEKVLTEKWTEKWRETQKILQEQRALGLRKSGQGVVLDSDMPHLVGIDDDVLSTGVTFYHLKEGETSIGSEEASVKQDIVLNGIGVEAEHCSIKLENGLATLIPKNQAQCWVNTVLIDKPTRLSQGCIILLGRTNMFRYNDPEEAAKLRREGSKAHLNLSRSSLLSWSTNDLAWSTENLNSSYIEEPERLEVLESERASLLKEKEAFKREQAERELDWEREQQERRKALEAAQKELEEERQMMEQEYQVQKRRLAEDWQRLEKQQQETLAALRAREMELKRKKEVLEWERDEEAAQVENETKKIEALKQEYEQKRKECGIFESIVAKLNKLRVDRLCSSEGHPGENGRNLSNEFLLQVLEENLASLENLKKERSDQDQKITSPLDNSSQTLSDKIKSVWPDIENEEDSAKAVDDIRKFVVQQKEELAHLEAELQLKLKSVTEHMEKMEKINCELLDVGEKQIEVQQLTSSQVNSEVFEAMKKSLAERTEEQLREIVERKQSLTLDLKPILSKSEDDRETLDDQPLTGDRVEIDLSSHGTDTFHTAVSLNSEPYCSPREEEGKSGEDENQTSSSQNSDCAVKSVVAVMSDSGVGLEMNHKGTGSGESSGEHSVKTNEPISSINLEFSEPVSVNCINKNTFEEERTEDKELFSCEDDSDELSSSPDEDKHDCEKLHSSRVAGNSPSSTEASSFEKVSPIQGTMEHVEFEELNMTVGEAVRALGKLYQEVTRQKNLIMDSLENECEKDEIKRQIAVLQDLQQQYIKLEYVLKRHPLRPLNRTGREDKDSNQSDLQPSFMERDLIVSEFLEIVERMDNECNDTRDSESSHSSSVHEPKVNDMDCIMETLVRWRTIRELSTSIPDRSRSPTCPFMCDSICSHLTDATSPYSRSLSVACDRCHLHGICIHIPSYILRGAGSSTHYEYEIKIAVGGDRWTVLRRYKRFRELHLNMKSKYGPKIEELPFPPRKFFINTSENVAKQRRQQLEVYLQRLVAICSQIESCPLHSCREDPTKLAVLEFSSFFRKGLFESGKYGTR